MSKGMWTKQFTEDEKVFYYNATLMKSVWSPPVDAVIHEAENLKPPVPESPAEIEKRKNMEAFLQFTETFSMSKDSNDPISSAMHSSSETSLQPPSYFSAPGLPSAAPNNMIQYPPGMMPGMADQMIDSSDSAGRSIDDVQQRLAQAAANQQKIVRSKRFKSQENKNEGDESHYQKLVSHYQAMSGKNADDSSKWLVR
mmetsp:Transcript_5517/g.5695  ORF Transcript_5517/g.5695 Transcript_5517/m.5695 type:complete len:198 (+) Transcript_5517:164-757(+)|eukprot:CAMPEP_0182427974 /NCGR_PEP_ID=MMETSP1167-20130531/20928_1 /TAXON_ID=2988 /ORGANISM="Mallomonas Sp, Strain CCMP3275" /LENGTH=197 /DNA_ID=CAMNT_0024610585 /DNA_START=59 /DNA_END=652 /DNA_ORIENTATION=+